MSKRMLELTKDELSLAIMGCVLSLVRDNSIFCPFDPVIGTFDEQVLSDLNTMLPGGIDNEEYKKMVRRVPKNRRHELADEFDLFMSCFWKSYESDPYLFYLYD